MLKNNHICDLFDGAKALMPNMKALPYLRLWEFKCCALYILISLNPQIQMSKTLESSPNALINKQLLDRYLSLGFPENVIMATYIWLDPDIQPIHAKDRVLDFVPKSVEGRSN